MLTVACTAGAAVERGGAGAARAAAGGGAAARRPGGRRRGQPAHAALPARGRPAGARRRGWRRGGLAGRARAPASARVGPPRRGAARACGREQCPAPVQRITRPSYQSCASMSSPVSWWRTAAWPYVADPSVCKQWSVSSVGDQKKLTSKLTCLSFKSIACWLLGLNICLHGH